MRRKRIVFISWIERVFNCVFFSEHTYIWAKGFDQKLQMPLRRKITKRFEVRFNKRNCFLLVTKKIRLINKFKFKFKVLSFRINFTVTTTRGISQSIWTQWDTKAFANGAPRRFYGHWNPAHERGRRSGGSNFDSSEDAPHSRTPFKHAGCCFYSKKRRFLQWTLLRQALFK